MQLLCASITLDVVDLRHRPRNLVVIGVVAAVALALAHGSSARRAADVAIPGWRLAFQHVDMGLGDVTGLDIATSERPRVTALNRRPRGSSSWDHSPRWSPDGDYVLFGRKYERPGVYVIELAGKTERRVAAQSAQPGEGGWSPDSRRAVFVRPCHATLPPYRPCTARVGVVDRDGRGLRTIASFRGLSDFGSDVRALNWTPDGQAILVLRTLRSVSEIVRIDVTTTQRTVLVRSGSRRPLGSAAMSPDGTLLAYHQECYDPPFRGDDTFCDLVVATPTGERPRVVVRSPRDHPEAPLDGPIVWLPGNRLLVTIWGERARTVIVDADTGRTTLISKNPWDAVRTNAAGTVIGHISSRTERSILLAFATHDGQQLGQQRVRLPALASDVGDVDLWLR